jgi:hypothetical protein
MPAVFFYFGNKTEIPQFFRSRFCGVFPAILLSLVNTVVLIESEGRKENEKKRFYSKHIGLPRMAAAPQKAVPETHEGSKRNA